MLDYLECVDKAWHKPRLANIDQGILQRMRLAKAAGTCGND